MGEKERKGFADDEITKWSPSQQLSRKNKTCPSIFASSASLPLSVALDLGLALPTLRHKFNYTSVSACVLACECWVLSI